MRTVECSCCGKAFQTNNGMRKYCSEECSYKMRLIIQKKWESENGPYQKKKAKKKKEENINKSICEINAEALKAGMSYGKYVSKMGL